MPFCRLWVKPASTGSFLHSLVQSQVHARGLVIGRLWHQAVYRTPYRLDFQVDCDATARDKRLILVGGHDLFQLLHTQVAGKCLFSVRIFIGPQFMLPRAFDADFREKYGGAADAPSGADTVHLCKVTAKFSDPRDQMYWKLLTG